MSDRLITLIAGLKAQVEEAIEQIKADDRMKEVLSLHQALNTLEATAAMPKTLPRRSLRLWGHGHNPCRRVLWAGAARSSQKVASRTRPGSAVRCHSDRHSFRRL